MANHLHKQIRDGVKTALTGLTSSGARVYANRLQPMADANLPGLRIYADNEQAEPLTMHSPHTQERTLAIVVECCAKAASALDDALDQMSKEVETALAAGITISSRNVAFIYTGMQFDDEQADKPVGVKRLTFTCTYTAANNAPDVLT
jgi:hypothetical protein